ncbi:hypothetical protein GFS31_17420 [Leptolyngbya sp. BL0902]|nr:hypothetical protein GFS31_17420 [Leptolyngbya sp. BL0902]
MPPQNFYAIVRYPQIIPVHGVEFRGIRGIPQTVARCPPIATARY